MSRLNSPKLLGGLGRVRKKWKRRGQMGKSSILYQQKQLRFFSYSMALLSIFLRFRAFKRRGKKKRPTSTTNQINALPFRCRFSGHISHTFFQKIHGRNKLKHNSQQEVIDLLPCPECRAIKMNKLPRKLIYKKR